MIILLHIIDTCIQRLANVVNNIILKKNQAKCEHDKLNFLLSSKKDIISYFQNIISEKNKEIEQYKIKINRIEKDISQSVFLKKPIFGKQIDYYDVIVHINSVKEINKGWKIEMSERGKKNYEYFKNENVLKLGVIGNANKGKSFFLSKISKISLPSGMSIKTEGLSIKYPDLNIFKNRKIVLLDSAGLETPVLISDIN